MGRTTRGISVTDIINNYCHFYLQKQPSGATTNQLYFFSKYKEECESLKFLGGNIYRENGGFAWKCGNRKQLVAIYKLIEHTKPSRHDIIVFRKWVKGNLI